MDDERKETAQGGLGVGARLNGHDQRIKELKQKVTKLEQRVPADGDLTIANKKVRISLALNEFYEGTVVAISKYHLKLKMEDGRERTFNKGHIRWHEEL